ncbi:major head protein precursor [Pectobacterium phage My1]|uniref:Major head protein n=1 Tax=Pectobacterium phage My1 TaxID=1204539 RepID=J9QGS5_9CAUD|nr:major head protein precursor [Pectobacterium phage My1]AFQ22300.1 major head protein precursor [Pectobacterium phage My1]
MPAPTNPDIQALLDAVKKGLNIDELASSVKTLTDAQKAEAAKKEKAEREALEQKRMEDMVAKATGESQKQLAQALELIQTMDTASKSSTEAFTKSIKEQEDNILALKDEIKGLLAAREGRTFIGDSVSKALFGGSAEAVEEEIEKLVLLASVMQKGVFETARGEAHAKAVNASSSIEVSTENYETIFSLRILRDLQKELIVGSLFEELPMSSKLLTMMVEPEAGEATWVDASTYGTPATVGAEDKTKLSEITFRTFKLAAKAYMTDETEEDAIFTLLPIMRRRLIEAHAIAIEKAFMTGTGVGGAPKGLLTMAEEDGQAHATAATATGTVLVTAKEIHKLRRHLGRHGLRLNKLVLVVSMDAYYDLIEDEEFQDVSQVAAADAIKLQGQVGRIYGMPVVVSEYFPDKAAEAPYCFIAYRENFVVPRQRAVTVEKERRASEQRDAYYVTQRVNLQRYFENGIVSGTYAA